MMKANQQEQKLYGWHLLAKDVADFCNLTFFEVFEKTAMEIFSTVQIMQAKIRINQNKANY